MMIDLSLYYRKIIRVRRGQYALPSIDERLLRALRLGGQLACRSALEYYSGQPIAEPWHILVHANASRFGAGDAVIHWTRRAIRSRTIVPRDLAERQARACRAAAAGRKHEVTRS